MSTTTAIHRRRAFAVLAVACFITTVDLTIVNVALPTIRGDLHFSESGLQWVVTAYALSFGGFLLLGGRAADLLGRRRILMLGVAVFTAFSLGAALASSPDFLIAMRGVQGLGSAIVLPAALAIVTDMFTEGAERNKTLGIWGGIGAAGGTAGLITGGLLTRCVGWETTSGLTIGLLGGSAALFAAFLVVESRVEAPLLPLRIFGVRSVAAANAVGPVGGAIGLLALPTIGLLLRRDANERRVRQLVPALEADGVNAP